MNDQCLACGAPCDGDLCDWICETVMLDRQEAAREAARADDEDADELAAAEER
jgi:hypothetical protein